MTDLSLVQSFSLIALNAQRSLHLTTEKKVALRCMAAAVILELYLDGGFEESEGKLKLSERASSNLITSGPTRWAVLVGLISDKLDGAGAKLDEWLSQAARLSNRKLAQLEHAIAESLKEQDGLRRFIIC